MTQIAGENSTTTMSGWFKEVYADKLSDVRPDGVRMYNDAPFVPKRRETGNTYNQPVALTHCHGFTYALADAGAFAINTPVAATMKNAQVSGAQLLLEERIDYETMARGEGSKKAFGSATRHIMRNMVLSFFKREEVRLLYGGGASSQTAQSGIFRFGAQTNDSGTTQTYSVTAASWAPGIMAGLENCYIDVYEDDGTGGLPSTKLNASGTVQITKVDFTNKAVTITGTEAELDDISTEVNTSAGCYAFFKGSYALEPIGFTTIAQQSTGSPFGISAATYGLWQGNEYAVGSTELTFDSLLRGLDMAVGKGLEGRIRVLLNPSTWTDVMADLAAARIYDSSYSTRKLTNGAKAVEFVGQNGVIDLLPSLYIKGGIALAYPASEVERVGASKMTFKMPGSSDDFVYQLPSNAGYGVRAYSNEAPFCAAPGKLVLYTGIVNGS